MCVLPGSWGRADVTYPPSLPPSLPHRVKYILNISREIDNFYPEEFKYLNIR